MSLIVAKGERLHSMKVDQLLTSVSFSPDGKWIASAGFDKTVRLWNAETGKQHHAFKGHGHEVMTATFSPDGARVVSGGEDGWLFVWDAQSVTR